MDNKRSYFQGMIMLLTISLVSGILYGCGHNLQEDTVDHYQETFNTTTNLSNPIEGGYSIIEKKNPILAMLKDEEIRTVYRGELIPDGKTFERMAETIAENYLRYSLKESPRRIVYLEKERIWGIAFDLEDNKNIYQQQLKIAMHRDTGEVLLIWR